MFSVKRRNRKLKEVSRDKIVSLSDYRRLSRSSDARTVLLYSFDEGLRQRMKEKFSGQGKLLLVDNRTAFDNFLESHELDFIILDQRHQTWKASDLCRQVRATETLSECTILVVTESNADKGDIIQAYKMGCEEVIRAGDSVEPILRTFDYLFASG